MTKNTASDNSKKVFFSFCFHFNEIHFCFQNQIQSLSTSRLTGADPASFWLPGNQSFGRYFESSQAGLLDAATICRISVGRNYNAQCWCNSVFKGATTFSITMKTPQSALWQSVVMLNVSNKPFILSVVAPFKGLSLSDIHYVLVEMGVLWPHNEFSI